MMVRGRRARETASVSEVTEMRVGPRLETAARQAFRDQVLQPAANPSLGQTRHTGAEHAVPDDG